MAVVFLFVTIVQGFRDTLMMQDPTSRVAQSIRYLRSQEGAKPTILFLGSSRTESCIDAGTFARESGMPCDKVLNIAKPDMAPWHMFVIVRHAPKTLADVKTAFVELAPHSFNENSRNPLTLELNKRPREFDAWAIYSERAQIHDAYTRDILLADHVFPLSQRRTLGGWLKIGKAILTQEPWIGDDSSPVYHQDGEKAAQLAADPRFEARTISQCHLYSYRFSEGQATIFRQLLTFLCKRGIEVVIFHPPVRAEYFDYVKLDAQMRNEFEKFRDFARDLSREHQVVYWETLADCGLDNSAVVDYGHFSREGALRFTRRLYAAVHASAPTIPDVTRARSPALGSLPAGSL